MDIGNGFRDEYIMEIARHDRTILSNMKNIDGVPTEVLLSIVTKIKETRTFDTVPKKIVLDSTEGMNSDCREIFKLNYSEVVTADKDEIIGTIKIGDNNIQADIEVIKTIKAVLRTGVCYSNELAMSCAFIVKSILSLCSTGYITKGKMLDCIIRDDYYTLRLKEAIGDVVNV